MSTTLDTLVTPEAVVVVAVFDVALGVLEDEEVTVDDELAVTVASLDELSAGLSGLLSEPPQATRKSETITASKSFIRSPRSR